MNNDKQLTPEEIAIKATENADKIQPKRWHIHWKGLWAGYIMGYTSAQDIHIQQTAAKDERIRELEEQHTYLSKREQELRAALDAEKKNAKEWYDLTIKWIKEADLRKKEGNARIAELEADFDRCNTDNDQLREDVKDKDARIAELEKERDEWKNKCNDERETGQNIQVWKDSAFNMQELASRCLAERDQAFGLLDKMTNLLESVNYSSVDEHFMQSRETINDFKQLLSSRENKKPNELGVMRPGEPGAGGYDPNNPPPEPETMEVDERPYIVLLERWLSEKNAKGSRVHRDTAEYLHEYYKENPQGNE